MQRALVPSSCAMEHTFAVPVSCARVTNQTQRIPRMTTSYSLTAMNCRHDNHVDFLTVFSAGETFPKQYLDEVPKNGIPCA